MCLINMVCLVNIKFFVSLYNEDKLGGMIRNLETWLKDIFLKFKGYKN